MKRLFVLLLAMMMVLSFTACGGKSGPAQPDSKTNGALTQKDMENADKALERLESMIPEGWQEGNYGADIYKVWDDKFLPDVFPAPIDGVEVDHTFFKDYKHDTIDERYEVGCIEYENKEDYREYGVQFYATEEQLDQFIVALEAKGFTGGQRGGRDDYWWEFHYTNDDGWYMYLSFNPNAGDEKFDGLLTAYATDSLHPLPKSAGGVPLPQKGVTCVDYTVEDNWFLIDGTGEDADYAPADPFPNDDFQVYGPNYMATVLQDVRDYVQQLVSLGWELKWDDLEEDRDIHHAELYKDGVYLGCEHEGPEMSLLFSNIEDNLFY